MPKYKGDLMVDAAIVLMFTVVALNYWAIA